MTLLQKIYLFVFAFSIQFSLAQTVNISIDKDSILIGDHIKLSIEASAERNADIYLPQPDSLGYFEFIEILHSDTFERKLQEDWLITNFDSGYYQFGGIPALFVYENGDTDTAFSNSVRVYVNTVPVDTSQAFMPLKPVQNMPFPWREVLPIILGLLAVLIAIILLILYFWYKKKKAKEEAERVKTPIEYFEEAIQELNELDHKKLWQKDLVKEYYFSLSEILREYMEGRFNIKAMESTTDEIMTQLEVDEPLKNKLLQILRQADLAKYAKFKPLGDENAKVMKLSKDFVLHTKPKVEIEEKDKK